MVSFSADNQDQARSLERNYIEIFKPLSEAHITYTDHVGFTQPPYSQVQCACPLKTLVNLLYLDQGLSFGITFEIPGIRAILRDYRAQE